MKKSDIDRAPGLVQASDLMERCAYILAACSLLLACCGDKREAHLEHFLTPGAAAKNKPPEPLDVFAVVEKPELADRIATMDFSEVAARLGAHRFQAHIDFEFTGKDHKVGLTEDDLIVQAQNGDFHVKVENDAGQGYEVVFSGGQFFMRNRYDPFHERDILTSDHIHWRDNAYGGFAAVYRLFRGRLAFSKLGMAKHHGRDAVRFAVSLAGWEPRLPGTVPPPAVPAGVKKYVYPIQPTPADRDRYRDLATPVEARGTLLLDSEAAVVLQVDLSGRLSFTAPEGDQPVSISVIAKLDSDGFGNPPSIPPPGKDEVKPIPERLLVDTRPLDFFFGKGFTSTLGPPAGVAAPPFDKPDAKPDPNAGGSALKP